MADILISMSANSCPETFNLRKYYAYQRAHHIITALVFLKTLYSNLKF